MDFAPSETHEITRKMVRDFAEREIAPESQKYDESQEVPHHWAEKMAGLGLLGVFVPEKWGGAGLDSICYAIVIEELSRVDASAGVIAAVNNGLVCDPILKFGSDAQKREWLVPLAKGQKLGAYALTEPGSGSDAAAMRTTAKREGAHWVLNGTKQFVTNAHDADLIVVYARTGSEKHDISAFLVPTDAPGFSRLKKDSKMGIRASDTMSLGFDGCRIPKDALLGSESRPRPSGSPSAPSRSPSSTPRSGRRSARRSPSSRPRSGSSRTWPRRSRPRVCSRTGRRG